MILVVIPVKNGGDLTDSMIHNYFVGIDFNIFEVKVTQFCGMFPLTI